MRPKMSITKSQIVVVEIFSKLLDFPEVCFATARGNYRNEKMLSEKNVYFIFL